MQITIINDCRDENAKLRQISRAGSLIKNSSVNPHTKGLCCWLAKKIFGFPDNLCFSNFTNHFGVGVNCFGVKSELEAAGFLVDAIDAMEGREGVILANVAPRGGKGKRWENGAPFGFFHYKKTLIVSSAGGLVLSLAKKLGIIGEFYIVDISDVLNSVKDSDLDQEKKDRIAKSQFRSFDFLPMLAARVLEGKNIPAEKYNLEEIADIGHCVWFIDNFGNIKTTLLKSDFGVNGKANGIKIGDKNYELDFYNRLKDLPNKSAGVVVGSSGFEDKRFLEIILQGGSASKKLGIRTDSRIEILNY